ncbi:MAG TPA: alpha/beta hydrolase-fold protein [Oscillatoriaceae cyanobacterium]
MARSHRLHSMGQRLHETLKNAPKRGRPPRRPHGEHRVVGPHVSGEVIVHPNVRSRHVGGERDVWVYLPPGYHEAGDRRYPVLYMHDGNNLFDAGAAFGGNEWHIDETAEWLIHAGELPPLVIVGVANTAERLDEYTWVRDPDMGGGKGAAYARFLIDEVRPLVEGHYRVLPGRDNTAVMGSSLGGLVSLYLGAEHGDVFGRVGAMSPSIWWAERRALADLAGVRTDLRLWLDMGSREGDDADEWARNLADAGELRRLFQSRGYRDGENLLYWEAEHADHSEVAWAGRAALALQFLFEEPPVQDGGWTSWNRPPRPE